jgi:hypothetical protein
MNNMSIYTQTTLGLFSRSDIQEANPATTTGNTDYIG